MICENSKNLDAKIRALSLGFRTEMIFHRFDGVIIDRDGYLVVKTPSNPEFMFGNWLLFFQAPKPSSLEKWQILFRKEFSDMPAVRHRAFLWDSPSESSGDVTELEIAGFRVDYCVVLTARKVHPPLKSNPDVEVRPIVTNAEWNEVVENQILSKAAEFEEASYRTFKERQMARYRTMAENGLGHWFGAFLNGKLVADLGIYRDGAVGRFQSVETHPDFRRQGICGTLVYRTAQFAFNDMELTELVMVADENYHAGKIYESVGFAPTTKEYSAIWWEKEKP